MEAVGTNHLMRNGYRIHINYVFSFTLSGALAILLCRNESFLLLGARTLLPRVLRREAGSG